MDLEKKRLGYFEGVLSSILNTILFGFKLWVGLAAGSVSMIADAWHTLSDTLTSLVVIVGFWIAARPGDKEHPFGHGRAELIASVVIGTLLGVVGVNFLRDSYNQLREHKSVVFSATAMIVFGISVVLKEAIAQFSMWAGKTTKSQSLIADGWHHRSDALASLMILIGALFGQRFWWLDGVLGLIVSLLILWAALQIIWAAANTLMGETPDTDLAHEIQGLVDACAPEASDIHHMHIHRYGDHGEITLHARVRDSMSLEEAHDISSRLEARIRDKLKLEATIHLEPRKRGA